LIDRAKLTIEHALLLLYLAIP